MLHKDFSIRLIYKAENTGIIFNSRHKIKNLQVYTATVIIPKSKDRSIFIGMGRQKMRVEVYAQT